VTNPLPNLLRLKMPLGSATSSVRATEIEVSGGFLPSSLFTSMLCVERKRAERSGRRLVVMLMDSRSLLEHGSHSRPIEKIWRALSCATRDTDIKGWHRDAKVIGVIFTEIPLAQESVIEILSRKTRSALNEALGAENAVRIKLSFHSFPDHSSQDSDFDSDDGADDPDSFSTIYPDLAVEIKSRRPGLIAKRCLDIAGSLLAIVMLAPLMALIAATIKLTSPGPVLFRQTRLGQGGKGFTFLKFRSMNAKADSAIHEAYVRSFIANQAETGSDGKNPTFKLQADPRITSIGRLLRRSSLDEIPQFFNVLAGQMSLVGPRPPLPYEFEKYKIWHRRRLLAVKPGITGFWQVEGRSRVKFDEMVRMDLAYARDWSLKKDIQILWRTPRAIMSGNGAC
jgi:lipopolysaccharide/colanic/teichoic acid biosynthesis glycosyltransferase